MAGAICSGPSATSQPECSSGDLRLVGGERESVGRVEICVEGFWGTVCDNQVWGREEAIVVCRQLGQPSVGMCICTLFKGNSVYRYLAKFSVKTKCGLIISSVVMCILI